MLDIRWIRENPQALIDALVKRGWSADESRSTVDDVVSRDEARRSHLTELQQSQERRNAASKEIGNAMRNGDMARAEALKAEVGTIKDFIQNGEARERELDEALKQALAVLPNVPLPDVPVGKDEHANVELRRVGEPRRINWAREHWELGEAMGLMDFERAAKLSGARFTVLKGQLARLERALGQFMLDLHTTEHGYTEVQPPLLVRDEAMFGTGQLPKFKEDLFAATQLFSEDLKLKHMQDLVAETKYDSPLHKLATDFAKFLDISDPFDRLWLIPTSEVPLTNLVREDIQDVADLPLRYTALTPCFRSEAGSAGRDTRGMLRQHQFYKVELVSITDEASSLAEHERMTACAEEVLKRLGLPFRTMVLSTGDMGFGAQKTHDIEVWLPGQNAYREISSCSVCGDFQARRMDARYRPKAEEGQGKVQPRFVHTLNGSGVAVGRALIAVMENYQNEDGSVTIPEALRPYMGGLERIG
ncbi:serine--tRNA ligase [Aquibium sp. ELW1220]|nr:serine--tRNA ligase [Aquibium sp. ELW1220]MDN2583785.1 serine--tRNA ligase [Aquibium sp. ELW1220]